MTRAANLSPVATEDTASACPSWRVVGAAVQGTSHARRGQPCQDWQGYRCFAGGGLVVAVADGAGSARRSERGSQRAVEVALKAADWAARALLANKPDIEPADWYDLMCWVFGQARRAVVLRARTEHTALRDYATTLTVAVAAGGWLAAAQIGDGAVVVQDAGGKMSAVTRLQKGEYANETRFLTERNVLKRLDCWADRCPVKALAVMSDGLVRLALRLPSGEPHPPFFHPLFQFVSTLESADPTSQPGQSLEAFLASERVCARTDDDKSLVLAAAVNGGNKEGA